MFTIKGLLVAAVAALGYFAVGFDDASTSAADPAGLTYYPNASLPMLFQPLER